MEGESRELGALRTLKPLLPLSLMQNRAGLIKTVSIVYEP